MFFAIIMILTIGIDGQVYPRELRTAPQYETRAECLQSVGDAIQDALPADDRVAGFSVTCVRLPQL